MRVLLLLPLFLLSACATLKTRYAGELTLACGKSMKAADYCSNFSASPSLQTDANVVRARDLCLGFYRQAIRSTNLVCGYFEELDSLSEWGEGEESATLSAKGKRIHRRYSDLAALFARELERAYTGDGGGGSKRALEELKKTGLRNLGQEVECEGVPLEAPGLLLVGLASQSAKEQRATYEQLQKALGELKAHTQLSSERPFLGLRKSFGVEKGGESSGLIVQRIAASHLDAPDLFQIGMAEIPANPALETYYAHALKRSQQTSREIAAALPKSGRAPASLRCAK